MHQDQDKTKFDVGSQVSLEQIVEEQETQRDPGGKRGNFLDYQLDIESPHSVIMLNDKEKKRAEEEGKQ